MASGFKLSPVSGVKIVAAAGTAERLVSASSEATRLSIVTFACNDNDGVVIGDSGIVWADGNTREGLIISDGVGTTGGTLTATIDLLSGWNGGLKGVHGMPYIDLFDLWADVETSGEHVWWFALRAV